MLIQKTTHADSLLVMMRFHQATRLATRLDYRNNRKSAYWKTEAVYKTWSVSGVYLECRGFSYKIMFH